ncbi:MAG: hypothetical protein CMI90_05250 [Pelagibacteraceae bacterium]|nr:hypothetical protein [Pelagibacteraceae bacterium]
METIVLTGFEGFIGNAIYQNLKNDYNIITLSKKNGYNLNKKIDIKTNLKIKYFIHAAYLFSNKKILEDELMNTNLSGIKNALLFCEKHSSTLIFLSSYIYGRAKYLPIDINHPINPHNLYAKSKVECEKKIFEFKQKNSLNFIILRLFNIYGFKQKKGNLIPDIISQINNKTIKLTHFNSCRDFLYIEDFLKIFKKILNNKFNKNQVLNVGSGQSVSIRKILKIIKKIKNNITYIETSPNHVDAVPDCYADISLLSKHYKWKPEFSIEDGIKKIIRMHE